MRDNENVLDEGLDKAFDLEGSNTIDVDDTQDVDTGDTNSEETTTNEEDNSLESLMQEFQNKTKEKSNKTDTNVDNSKQNKEQQPNKQPRNNNSQDLLDKDGNVLAKGGAERRLYEENAKLKRERDHFNTNILPVLKQNYTNMQTKLASYDEAFKAMHSSDLTPDDIQTGIELIRNWKKSPEDTIKFLLTQAKSYGINVDNDKTGVDMAAINTMLDQKLQPFIQEREQAIRMQQSKVSARNIYNNFMARYPDAANHKEEIAYLYRKNPNMGLDAIYYQLKNHYYENGYDFSTPLREILKNNSQKPNTTKSFSTPNVNQSIKTQQIRQSVAPVSKSYGDIIRETFKELKK